MTSARSRVRSVYGPLHQLWAIVDDDSDNERFRYEVARGGGREDRIASVSWPKPMPLILGPEVIGIATRSPLTRAHPPKSTGSDALVVEPSQKRWTMARSGAPLRMPPALVTVCGATLTAMAGARSDQAELDVVVGGGVAEVERADHGPVGELDGEGAEEVGSERERAREVGAYVGSERKLDDLARTHRALVELAEPLHRKLTGVGPGSCR